MQIDPVLAGAAQSGVAVAMLLAALAKTRKAAAFRAALHAYQLLPDMLVAPVAWLIVAAEALGAVALLLPETRCAGAVLLSGLLLTFATALAVNVLRGRIDIDCGCFAFGTAATAADPATHAPAASGIGWWHVARALLLAALAATAFVPTTARAIIPFDYLTLSAAVLAIVSTLLTIDALLANLPRLDHLRNS
jgi:hypothetical protein